MLPDVDWRSTGQPHVRQRLDQTFNEMVTQIDVPAVSVALWSKGSGLWTAITGQQVDVSSSFWWASVGKMITAAIVFQLVDEEQLDLQQRVSQWLPEVPAAAWMTVDDLLQHRAGVFSFQNDKKLNKRPGYHAPEKLLRTAQRHGPDFCPGGNWYYSNTGYLMLGLIAQQVQQTSLAELVSARVAGPLGVSSLQIVQRDVPIDHLVLPADESASQAHAQIASLQGVGGIVGNPTDMLIVLHAVLSARLFAESHLRLALSELHPMFGSSMHYGRGLMVVDLPEPDNPTVWLGHTGGAPGAKAVLVYDTQREALIALVGNRQFQGEALANALLKTLPGSQLDADRAGTSISR